MSDSRTKNTKRNIVAGLIYKFIGIILPFITRTVLIRILGTEFTGLSSLFSSILQVLNIAELGFNSAIVYSLYEPMANDDKPKIIELVSLFRKIYNIVGTIILVGGMIIMPFLKTLINGTYPSSINIYILYILYLINSVLSYYLFAYKEVLLIADQRQDIASMIRTITSILRYILEIVALIITHNFYVYLSMDIIATVLTNILIEYSTSRRYSYFSVSKDRIPVPQELKKQVSGLLVDRLSDTCRNSFDSLIITAFIGLTATAIYGNYYYIYTALYSIMLIICNAMSASVGNSIVKETVEKNYDNFNNFTYLFAWLAGWTTITLFCLYQPFMRLWVGQTLLLSARDMCLFCLYFYAINMNNIRNQYISGTGIWWKLKIPCIVEAAVNLVLNIVLGKLMGITGVLTATILTIFLLNFLWRTSILFKEYFTQKRFLDYVIRYLYYFVITVIALSVTYFVCVQIKVEGIFQIVSRGIVCLFVPNIILFMGFRPLKQYENAKNLVFRVIKNKEGME